MASRYTLTYTPSVDRILPIPEALRLRIRNTSAVPLRAAYLHGPYTLHVSAYPSTFDPNRKVELYGGYGLPEYEPQLKAGGSWDARLHVPEDMRRTGKTAHAKQEPTDSLKSVTWVVEITSQVIFSSSATVHFELLIGRDELSLSTGLARLAGSVQHPAGKVQDHQQDQDRRSEHRPGPPQGVYSKAVKLTIDDTTSLWNKPAWPRRETTGEENREIRIQDPRKSIEASNSTKITNSDNSPSERAEDKRKQKRVHLVILTHGLHSNLSADLLYLKESIDVAAREARQVAKERRAKQAEQKLRGEEPPSRVEGQPHETSPASSSHIHFKKQNENVVDDESDEEVIVRGFAGNVIRTERGIKYLGKRLAKYVLRMTFPQQPYLPVKRPGAKSFASSLRSQSSAAGQKAHAAHPHSSLYEQTSSGQRLPYEITSISFVGHSLGGLVQTYAIAYIQKHSPNFFEIIRPINFIALATPFLGLSNENPLYVKFALDFGLVGRTGQDLGLAWRAPNITRSGWSAIVGNFGIGVRKPKAKLEDPRSKPLLRILPTGPAHIALKAFRNRTVYANVVNDGIVPLRTSCLLFLDWSSLGRVEKARRENGLVGTMAEWGWAELTGSKVTSHRGKGLRRDMAADDALKDGREENPSGHDGQGRRVPQPSESAAKDSTELEKPEGSRQDRLLGKLTDVEQEENQRSASSPEFLSALTGFLNIFSSREKHHQTPAKGSKMYKRSQTINGNMSDPNSTNENGSEDVVLNGAAIPEAEQRQVTAMEEPGTSRAPPRTTFFESAGALLSPPIPPMEFIIDPSSRPRTIFHDRVYHPADIPSPPLKRRSTFARSLSGFGEGNASKNKVQDKSASHHSETASTGMTVEEKIARAYHRDMSWRKVLVRLEPDAHNNIIVRRMFANAYGWPVIKHLVETHFADTVEATTRDDEEPGVENAKEMDQGVGEDGEEVKHERGPTVQLNAGDAEENKDGIGELRPLNLTGSSNISRPTISREDSVQWSDADFEVTDDEDDVDMLPGSIESAKRSTSSRNVHDMANGHKGRVPSKPQSKSGSEPVDVPVIIDTNKASSPQSKEPMSEVPLEDAIHVGLSRSVEQQRDEAVMVQVTKLASSPGKE